VSGSPRRPDAGTRVVAAEAQVSCELEGEAVILDLSGGVYYGLDPVGAHVWALLDRERSVAELRDAVVSAFEVDAATAEADLVELLEELAARGLVELR
jgi:hypothetical protein